MEKLTLGSFLQVCITIIILSIGQVFLKLGLGGKGIPKGSSPLSTFWNLVCVMVRPKSLVGFSLYVIGTFIWLVVLSKLPLSIAFPLFSMSYFMVVFLSSTVLREKVDWRFAAAGLLLISMGVTFIGLSSPPKNKSAAHKTVTTVVKSPVGDRGSSD